MSASREESGAMFPVDGPYQSRLGTLGLAVAVGLAYFMAAELGLALRTSTGTSVFWPAAGISVAALIVWGPRVRMPVAAGVVVATAVSNLTIGRNPWLAVAFGIINAGQALLTTTLIERWFGRLFRLGNVSQVLWFLVASTIGAAVAAMGAAIAVDLIGSAASPLNVWRFWFASCLLGIVTVAPLLVGVAEAVCHQPPRRELVLGAAGVAMLAAISVFVISLPQGAWSTALPMALVFPILLWVAVRCQPVFAAAAAFVGSLAAVWSITFSIGHFGDATIPLADRILAAQTVVLTGALLTLVLAALFAERRRSEVVLEQSKQRLQLALDGAELGAFSADLATGRLECDARAALIHGHNVQPTTIRESRRFVHPNDRVRIDAALVEAQRTGGIWNAEYRVVHPAAHPHAGKTRWVAVEGSIVRDLRGTPVGLLGVTRDITDRKETERTLAERNLQLALASKSARVGSYTYDVESDLIQVSEGYVAVHGLTEGTRKTTRTEWQARTLPEDLPRVQEMREQAFRERLGEYSVEYRIVCSNGEVRWVESRSFISYDGEGRPERVIGVNIDITQRKQAEAALAERNTQIELASRIARVGSFAVDFAAGIVRLSPGCATLYGLPEGTIEISRDEARKHVHLEDLPELEAGRDLAFLQQQSELVAQFRIVRADSGEVRWVESRNLISYGEDGRPLGMIGVSIDVTERKKAELTLAERTMQLALAGKIGLVGNFAYDIDTERMQISAGYAAIHGFPDGTKEIPRSEWQAGVLPEDSVRWEKLRNRAHRERWNEYSGEYRIVRPDGEVRWIEARVSVWYRSDGRPQRAVGVDIDITARKRAEEQQRALNAELDHRVKNILATVCAIIIQTPKADSSLADYVAGLDDRIKSLARTHELLSENQWHGVSLEEIVRRELAPYAADNVEMGGPRVTLKAEAAQAVGMVLHELATNAAKYGAFSKKSGRLLLRWRRLRNGSRGGLAMEWQELDGPPVVRPSRFGYGTGTIRELIPFELGGAVDLGFASGGLQCRLEIPGDWVRRTGEPSNSRGLDSAQTSPQD